VFLIIAHTISETVQDAVIRGLVSERRPVFFVDMDIEKIDLCLFRHAFNPSKSHRRTVSDEDGLKRARNSALLF
jgi:hypothetical protein